MEAIAGKSGRTALEWLRSAERYFREAPERATVIRGQDDAIAGYVITMTPASAPAFAASDPLIGPRMRHACELYPSGAVVLCRQAIDRARERSSPVTALIGMARGPVS